MLPYPNSLPQVYGLRSRSVLKVTLIQVESWIGPRVGLYVGSNGSCDIIRLNLIALTHKTTIEFTFICRNTQLNNTCTWYNIELDPYFESST